MAVPIAFRRIAKREMDESIAWYESQREQLGLEFGVEIQRTLLSISDNPAQFPLTRGDIRRALLRRFPCGVHYLIEDNQIIVVAIFHVKRNPTLLEDR